MSANGKSANGKNASGKESQKGSKFGFLTDQRESEVELIEEPPAAIAAPDPTPAEDTPKETEPTVAAVDQQNGKKPGRPPGKRSDPGYMQVTAYIRRETYEKTMLRLQASYPRREFSELVEQLVAAWLKEE